MDRGATRSAGAATAVLVVALGLSLGLGLGLGGTAVPAEASEASGASGLVPQTDDVDPDRVVLRAAVAENGTASWTVEYRVRLDDENVTEAFSGLQSDIRANRSEYADRFGGRMNATVSAAENATGREMSLADVSVTAERRQLPQSYGVVSYRFEWRGFAAVDGDRLLIGDALSGLFLDAESQLVIAWPDGYEASSVTPGGYEERDGSVVWEGPVDFGPDQPRVVVRPAGGLPLGAVVAGVLLLLGGVAAAVAYRRQQAGGRADDAGGQDGTTAAATGGGAGTDAGAGAGTGTEAPPEELLSPEERVLRFVREHGGRVKQQEVVSEFDWTAARTSQVVGNLRDDGEIETFRLGRENVLTLPETDVVGGEGDGGDGDGDQNEDDADEGVDWRPDEG